MTAIDGRGHDRLTRDRYNLRRRRAVARSLRDGPFCQGRPTATATPYISFSRFCNPPQCLVRLHPERGILFSGVAPAALLDVLAGAAAIDGPAAHRADSTFMVGRLAIHASTSDSRQATVRSVKTTGSGKLRALTARLSELELRPVRAVTERRRSRLSCWGLPMVPRCGCWFHMASNLQQDHQR